MRWKYRFFLFAAALVIEIPLIVLKVNPLITIAITFVVIVTGYFCWWNRKYRRVNDILEEKCAPVQFIEECEKLKLISKRISFQNSCNLNIAIGLMSLGRIDEALNTLLQKIDLRANNSQIFKLTYHLAIFCCYLDTDNLDNATYEYETYLKELRKNAAPRKIIYSFDLSFSEYQYMLNKTPETARVFLGQMEHLYSLYSRNISKRIKLSLLYIKAEILLELGDYDSAAENYQLVSENGNGLWIVEASKKKLSEIESHQRIENQ